MDYLALVLFTQHLLHISEADAGRPVYSFLCLTPFPQLFSGVVSQASPVYVMWTGVCLQSCEYVWSNEALNDEV